jgi:hypothetical protein
MSAQAAALMIATREVAGVAGTWLDDTRTKSTAPVAAGASR